MAISPLLTILLPVRNAASDLPGFLHSVSRYADAVVALDDGSTDDTQAILAAHPLVKVLLTNPAKTSYIGWNDAENRNATLAGAARLTPEWILSLDADERIDEADGLALRAFLESDALPGLGYSFRRFEMRGDHHHLPVGPWQHRLFAYEPGQRFTTKRLHFPPIPVSIPRSAYVLTTVRIQHFGGATLERRRAQYEKYRLTDPDCLYWPSYTRTLHDDPLEPPVPWIVRAPDLPVIGFSEVPDQETVETLTVFAPPHHPAMKEDDGGFEWIASTTPMSLLNRRLLERASGTVVIALTSELLPRPGALGELLAGHAAGYALVAPAIHAPVGEGAFARFARRRYGPTTRAEAGSLLDEPPVRCSYRRSLLLDVLAATPPGSVAALNQRLFRDGHRCLTSKARLDVVDVARWSSLAAARGYVQDGKDEASAALDRHRLAGRLLRPPKSRGPRDIRARPILTRREQTPAELLKRVGAFVELARPSQKNLAILVGAPQQVALWDLQGRDGRRLALVSWSLERNSVRWAWIPAALQVERPNGDWVALGDAMPPDRRLRRFDLHELVAHPLAVLVDEHVRLRVGDGFGKPASFARAIALPTLRDMSSVETSIDRLSLVFALVTLLGAKHEMLAPWATDEGGRLGVEAAAKVSRFFAGHQEVDLGTLRDQARHKPIV